MSKFLIHNIATPKSPISKLYSLGAKVAAKLLLKNTEKLEHSHVNFSPSPEWQKYSHFKGKFLKRIMTSEGKKEMKMINHNKEAIDIVALGGLDFDNPRNISALLKSLETLLPKDTELKSASIYPSVDREARYDAAVTYNHNKLYYPEYIEVMVREHILPRFIDLSTNSLKETIKHLTFYSFSVGGREIPMIENCLRHIFSREYGLSSKEISSVFNKINGVSIAYAIDYDNLPEPRFQKLVVLSEDDIGILKPLSLASNIMADISVENHSKINFYSIEETELSAATQVFYLKSGAMPMIIDNGETLNISTKGHSLPHYIDSITENPNLHALVVEALGVESIFTPAVNDLTFDWITP